jgi:hypothetical protein
MTAVRRLAPDPRLVDLEAELDRVGAAPALAPFDERAIAACDAIARRLFADPRSRAHPELIVVASWLRRASTLRLAAECTRQRPQGVLRAPRGIAFHVPPATVDVMAIYSLGLSLLAGNRNVVRLSSRSGPAAGILCAAIEEALRAPAPAEVRAGTAILTWGHEPELAARCSAACDVRLLWGGDAAVRSLQAYPIGVHARDLAFFDRFSLAAVRAEAWLAASETTRDEQARRFSDDMAWFHQQACSSPRLIVWCGTPEAARAAAQDFFGRLAAALCARDHALPLGAVSATMAWVAGTAIDRPVRAVRRWSNELTVVELETLAGLDRAHPGGGVLLEAHLPELTALASHVGRRDQTLTTFGFTPAELEAFVAAAAGRGVDRIVGFGRALAFDVHWDGMDLLAELTREVVIGAGEPEARDRPAAA